MYNIHNNSFEKKNLLKSILIYIYEIYYKNLCVIKKSKYFITIN